LPILEPKPLDFSEKIELSDGELVCLAFLSRLGGVEFSFDFGGSLAPQFPHTGALS